VGYRNCWRFRKFYWSQVEEILAIIKRFYADTNIDLEKYLNICEQLGQEPDPDKMPPDVRDLPYEVQVAFFVHDLLSDRWEGFNGIHLGKDWAPISQLYDIYEVENKKVVTYFLKHIEAHNSEAINKKQDDRRKAEERKAKSQPTTRRR
jgi:hypothetical protein